MAGVPAPCGYPQFPLQESMTDAERRTEFEEMLRRHERQLFGYLFSLVRGLHDTEDLFQQTTIALWEQFDSFEPGTNFAAWACTVAKFRALRFLERNKRPHVSFSEEAHAALMAVEAAADPDELDARREALARCVEELPVKQRELLLAFYEAERPVKELAAERERTTHSIYSSLRNTRRRLMECVTRVLAAEGRR